MTNFTTDFVATARAAAERADRVHECGTKMEVGYSNLGIPVTACPTCAPTLVANGKRTVGEAWGFNER